jgi:hypothetical protein
MRMRRPALRSRPHAFIRPRCLFLCDLRQRTHQTRRSRAKGQTKGQTAGYIYLFRCASRAPSYGHGVKGPTTRVTRIHMRLHMGPIVLNDLAHALTNGRNACLRTCKTCNTAAEPSSQASMRALWQKKRKAPKGRQRVPAQRLLKAIAQGTCTEPHALSCMHCKHARDEVMCRSSVGRQTACYASVCKGAQECRTPRDAACEQCM